MDFKNTWIVMNIKELTIGDWVAITEPDYFNGYVGEVVTINGETGYVTVHIPNMHPHDVFVEDLQPIPLTSEILEKNNYKRNSWCICGSWQIHEYKISDGLYYNLESGLLLFGYAYDASLKIKCNYVHELQHALKLCKIEKEIVL